MLSEADLNALILTIQLAFVTTAILLLLGVPLGWWLAKTEWRFKFLLDAVIALPLVLPPTVLGFYFLLFLGPKGPFGNTELAFTFPGLVIGSVVYSFPFVVQPIRNAFAAIPREQLEVASTLGSTHGRRFLSVALPLAKPGILTGAVLGFAHTLGEFGVVLMIGGNIPGSTRVVSIAIYDHVESLEYHSAHQLSLVLLVGSFLMLVLIYGFHRHQRTGLI